MDNQQILEALDDIVTFREEPTSEQIEALMEAMDIVEKYSQIGGWIPCSERLPEEEGVYLVTKPNFGNWVVDTMYFCRGSFTDKYVIAWQPLPEAYHG